jgi:UDP-N-acetylmuramoyl-tripeptide--D-alanyl-D-alanine ligase
MRKVIRSGLDIKAKEIERITNGVLEGDSDFVIDSISTDSRTIEKDELFAAIEGENYNGHDFVLGALEKGACGAIIKRGFKVAKNMKQLKLFLEVDDTLKAYQDIAAYNRSKSGAKVVAITGSSGKTTTKEMLHDIMMAKKGVAIVSEKNFNNFIGIPMTLLNIRKKHKIVIVEVGINQIDEMDRLASITNPDIALVTNAGSAHLEFLKNVDTVSYEKMKLADGLKEGGTLVFNYDDLRLLRDSKMKKVNTLTYGFSDSADIVGMSFKDINLNKSRLKLRIKDELSVTLNLKINGIHNAYNALAAISVSRLLNVPMNDIVKGLESFVPKDMRSENIFLNDDIVVVNDAYNANPDSMKASLEFFADLKGAKKKIAVLGDMNELGEYSKRAHKEAGVIAYNLKIDLLFLYGEEMKEAAKGAGYCGMAKKNIFWFNDHDSLFETLYKNVEKGDWILIKGSRQNRLEIIAEKLTEKIGLKR